MNECTRVQEPQQDFTLYKAIGTHVTSQPSLSGKQVMASLFLQEAMSGWLRERTLVAVRRVGWEKWRPKRRTFRSCCNSVCAN